jgi:hypothetical protein
MMSAPNEPSRDEGKPAPLTQVVYTVSAPDNRHYLAVAAKRSYSFKSGRAELADEQAPLNLLPVFDVDADGAMTRLHDEIDLVAPKLATDLVIQGTVRCPAPTPRHTVGVKVGRVERTLELIGPRRVHIGARTEVRFEEPAPFSELTLDLAHAYGGFDAFAQLAYDGGRAWLDVPGPRLPKPPGAFAYPRNPFGVGYFIDVDRRRADGAPLPRIEDPADPLLASRLFVKRPSAWIDAPMPGNLGFVPYHCYPRMARLAGPLVEHDPATRPLAEARFDDADDLRSGRPSPARGLQSSAPGMAVDRLRGSEAVLLRGMFPGTAEATLMLPGERPRVKVAVPDLGNIKAEAELSTVRIDLDKLTVSLTWVAASRVSFRVPETELVRCTPEVQWRASN